MSIRALQLLAANPSLVLALAAHPMVVREAELARQRSDKLRGAGLDPEKLMPEIRKQAEASTGTIDQVIDMCIQATRKAEHLDREELQRAAALRNVATVCLTAPPHIEMPWTPPPRRSSKRAQRARERHWGHSDGKRKKSTRSVKIVIDRSTGRGY